MMSSHTEAMNVILDFIKTQVPSIIVHITTKADFPEDTVFPPCQEVVAKTVIPIVTRLLK